MIPDFTIEPILRQESLHKNLQVNLGITSTGTRESPSARDSLGRPCPTGRADFAIAKSGLMDISFIYSSLKLSFWLTLILSLFFSYFLGSRFTLGLLSGSLWNIANMFLFIGLTKALVSACRSKWKIAFLVIAKFGILYGIGFLIVSSKKFSLYGIFLGFSIFFAVISFKALAKTLFNKQ